MHANIPCFSLSKVVDKKTKLNGDTIAVNSIGLCGSVGHALISRDSRLVNARLFSRNLC